MQEVVGSNPTEGKICCSQFTLFYRMECKKLFCKTKIKLKVLKLNKTKYWKLLKMAKMSLYSFVTAEFFKNDRL